MAKRTMNNRRRPRQAAKYVFRRFMLVLILVILVLGGCVFLGYKLATISKNQDIPSSVSDSPSSSLPDETSASVSSQEPSQIQSSVIEPEEEPMEPDWRLLLVNKQNPVPEGYEAELVKVVDEFKVDERVSDSLLRMIAGAREDGVILIICSAYRPYEKQEQLYENKKNEIMAAGTGADDAVVAAAAIVAPPGRSEHQTGLAVDIVTKGYESLDDGFEDTIAFRWLRDNAAEYGFILRYPKDKTDITDIIYEPWHYRYVGVEYAKEITESGLCLEEYLDELERKRQPEPSEENPEESAEDADK